MSNKQNKPTFAPVEKCPNKNPDGNPAFRLYRKPFEEIRREIKQKPHDYAGPGTVVKTPDLRWDCQKLIEDGTYANCAVQANRGADNAYLRRIAERGNGSRKVRPETNVERGRTLGGSTVASVNVQRYKGQLVSPGRVAHAVGHSAGGGEIVWVQNRESNINDVPECIRQHSGIYHSNPLKKQRGP